jgi:hypothetical protein
MSDLVKRINDGLAIRHKIRLGHHEAGGVCAECGQSYPCITIQSMNGTEDVMSENSAGKKKKKKK